MSTLQRPLFNMPPGMMEGTGITSMAMDAPPPMAMDAPPPMAMEGQMAMDEQAAADLGGMLAGQLAAGVEQTEQNIDAAEDSVGIMNALRGKNQTEEEYRDELAQYVGPNDAKYTPDSVLALVQPTMAMMEMGDMAAMMPGAGEGGLGEMMAVPDMAAMMPTIDMVGGVAEILPPSDMPVAEGPQVFGSEEEIFGKMPVQKLQSGGQISAFDPVVNMNPASPQGMTLPSFGPLVEQRFGDISQLYTGLIDKEGLERAYPEISQQDKVLRLMQSAIPALLGPQQRGGGNRWLNALQSVGTEATKIGLAESERQTKLAQQLYGQELAGKEKALSTAVTQVGEEQQKAAELLSKINIANLKDSDKFEYRKLTQDFRNLKEKIDQGTAGQNDVLQLNQILARMKYLTTKTTTPGEIEAGRQRSDDRRLKADIFKDQNQRYGELNVDIGKDLDEKSERTEQIRELNDQMAAINNAIPTKGPGAPLAYTLASAMEQIGTISGLPPRVIESVGKMLPGYLGDDRQITAGQLNNLLRNQTTLQYTGLFPGNLNAAEVNISAGSGAIGLGVTPAAMGIQRKIFQIQRDRARDKRNLWIKTREDYARSLKKGEQYSEKALYDLWLQKSRDFQAEIEKDTTIVDMIKGSSTLKELYKGSSALLLNTDPFDVEDREIATRYLATALQPKMGPNAQQTQARVREALMLDGRTFLNPDQKEIRDMYVESILDRMSKNMFGKETTYAALTDKEKKKVQVLMRDLGDSAGGASTLGRLMGDGFEIAFEQYTQRVTDQ